MHSKRVDRNWGAFMEDLTLVIMAAGLGSRYGGLKQIDAVGQHGERIVDYSIYDAVQAGFRKFVFVITRELDRTFRQMIGERIAPYAQVDYAYQALEKLPQGYTLPAGRRKPWGTAHAVLCAAPKIHGPFAVINADDFYGRETFSVLAAALRGMERAKDGVSDFCMAGFALDHTVSDNGYVARGICTVDKDGYLQNIVERTQIMRRHGDVCYTQDASTWHKLDANATVSMNCWGFTTDILDELRAMFPRFLDKNLHAEQAEFFLPAAVDALLCKGKCRVKVLQTSEKWFGVTYKKDKPAVVQAIQALTLRGQYPAPLWGGPAAASCAKEGQ